MGCDLRNVHLENGDDIYLQIKSKPDNYALGAGSLTK